MNWSLKAWPEILPRVAPPFIPKLNPWEKIEEEINIKIAIEKSFVQNGEDAFKWGNFSLVGGVQLHLLKFRIYGRFVGGTTNLANIQSSDTWKTSAIQLGVGIGL